MTVKILLVEDESVTRKSLTEFLQNHDYEIVEAADGADALKLLGVEDFDLVITDFVLPRVDGLHLTDVIQHSWPHIPVLLISGYLSVAGARAILKDRAEVMSKPIDHEELLRTVRRLTRPKA